MKIFLFAFFIFLELLPGSLHDMKDIKQMMEIIAEFSPEIFKGRLSRPLLICDERLWSFAHMVEEVLKYVSEILLGLFLNQENPEQNNS